jgi:hypothetical protein
MQGKSYRLKSPTLDIISENGHSLPVTIRQRAVLKAVVDAPVDSNRLVDIMWEDKVIMMFTEERFNSWERTRSHE